jgi:hypothetical protein
MPDRPIHHIPHCHYHMGNRLRVLLIQSLNVRQKESSNILYVIVSFMPFSVASSSCLVRPVQPLDPTLANLKDQSKKEADALLTMSIVFGLMLWCPLFDLGTEGLERSFE